MISDSKRVQSIVEIFAQKEIYHIVFSPGSRNAPLVLSFVNDDRFNCVSIVDERSAAFYALGIALEIGQPVAICCTSGSASLNYSSAISEAYYQKIPLIAITTDRPPEWINHGEGQSINQEKIFNNIVYSSYSIPIGEEEDDIWYAQRVINEAINNSKEYSTPVHLNFPFREPLYNIVEKTDSKVKLFSKVKYKKQIEEDDLLSLAKKWNDSKSIMILCGQMSPDQKLNHILEQIGFSQKVAILTESTANLHGFEFIPCIDRVITNIKENQKFIPELLITVGDAIVSKKIKKLLRNSDITEHWSIKSSENAEDTFIKLNTIIPFKANYFFRKLINHIDLNTISEYKSNWLQEHKITNSNHDNFINTAEWSDLKAFNAIYNTLPENCNLHLGNSSPIRYMQLFNQIKSLRYYSNRGVSGIDGSTSTMCGVSSVNQKLNILISGDLSFVYDINALWNNHLTPNIRIIIINNAGGGIFRIIPGPKKTNVLDDFFEVGNHANIKLLCEAHEVNYYTSNNIVQLNEILPNFYNGQSNNRPAVLEIFTPKNINAEVLNNYFKSL